METTRLYLLFCVDIPEYPILTLIAFLFSAFISAPSELRESFEDVVDVVSEGVWFLVHFRVLDFVDAVGFLLVCHECPSDASLDFLAHWCSMEID